MALNTCEMWSNRIKITFFSKNLQTSPSSWGQSPQTPIASGGWGLRPQTPVCDTFEYTSLLNTSPKLDLHFPTISFRPFPLPKSCLSANGLQLQIFHSTISLPHKKSLFWKFLMTSLHVICGLGPPNQKSWLRLCARFLAFSNEISTVQKIVLSLSRGQGNFRGLEASRPRPRTWLSMPRPRPRTSKCVLEDVLEAKDVLEDSTSGLYNKV